MRYKISMIEKKEILYNKEVQKLRKQHTDTLSSLQSRYDALSKEYRSLESVTSTRIERLEREKTDLLARLKAMLDKLHEKLREAVKAFMEFSKSVLRELSIRNRDTIVEYLADSPDVRNDAHTLKVFARPFL